MNQLILDLGCGNRKVKGAVGIDIKPNPEVNLISDISDLPFDNETADKIYLRHVLEHTNDLQIIKEIKRVLRPLGILHIAVPNAYYLPLIIRYIFKKKYSVSLEHIHAYGIVELGNLLVNNGFKIDEIRFSDYCIEHQTNKTWLDRLTKFVPNLKGEIQIDAYKMDSTALPPLKMYTP